MVAGTANNTLSKRSSQPPWPGRILPESLTLSERLMSDSHKSPQVPKIEQVSANPIHCQVSSMSRNLDATNAAMAASMRPPQKPSHDFLGEMR